MTKWYGWVGTILNVDLSNMKLSREPLSQEFAIKYIGGAGFADRILYDEVSPGPADNALEPENVLIIAPGTLSGTTSPSSSRYLLTSKSPLSGIFASSDGGGFFGSELKHAGYDLIVIRGKAEKPVYLWIDDEHVELKDATHLWGKDTWATDRIIRKEMGDPDIKVIKIGPAGENMCYSAVVIGDLGRAAATRSLAAVWGSKNLKAVAVRGSKGVSVAKPKEFIELCQALTERAKLDPMYSIHTTYGTSGWVHGPLQGLRTTGKPLTAEYPLHHSHLDAFYDKNLACFSCPYHCTHFYSVKSGKYKGISGEGMESGGGQGVGVRFGVMDPAFAFKVNNMCNRLGITTGPRGLNWAWELYQDGIITKEDTDGLELIRGDEEVILKLLHKIAYKEGFGEIMDEPIRGAEKLGRGSSEYIPQSKRAYGGTTALPPGRGRFPFTFAWTLSTRGWDRHLTGQSVTIPGVRDEISDDHLRKLGRERYNDPEFFFQPSSKPDPKQAQELYNTETTHALCAMTATCTFASHQTFITEGIHDEDFVQLLSTATGVDFSLDDLVRATERKTLLERAFNAREGIRRMDDYPYPYYYQLKYGEKAPRVDYSQVDYSIEDYGKVLDEYYRLRGCDLETGIPTRQKLESLGMKDVADDLASRGILSP